MSDRGTVAECGDTMGYNSVNKLVTVQRVSHLDEECTLYLPGRILIHIFETNFTSCEVCYVTSENNSLGRSLLAREKCPCLESWVTVDSHAWRTRRTDAFRESPTWPGPSDSDPDYIPLQQMFGDSKGMFSVCWKRRHPTNGHQQGLR